MNAADHFREAEQAVRDIESSLRDIDPALSDADLHAQIEQGATLALVTLAAAQVHATLALAAIQRPTHTVGGDEFVYDGIGKAEINRLRSLLSHEDRDRLTTWEVVEVAADELAAARQAVSS